jgi:hypothetical protein
LDLIAALDEWCVHGSAEAADSIVQHAEQIIGWCYLGSVQISVPGVAMSAQGNIETLSAPATPQKANLPSAPDAIMPAEANESNGGTAILSANALGITFDVGLRRITRNGELVECPERLWKAIWHAYHADGNCTRSEFCDKYTAAQKPIGSKSVREYVRCANIMLIDIELEIDTERYVLVDVRTQTRIVPP